ncbi:MAG: hypothetical protein LKG14_02140 [Prevotella sp.]|uniref:Uncharacterized protein n=1 Tax=Segatella cerevisiae TaxID=2053716 RepID=A0ABT1C051_9BACT|nr:hypothetical protein [Segatella cerevisiae]MCH3994922.1 hypothetical protein [Prevotella sp.]MCI1246175.1 hypothetical protein [Prevotella sp.]MCO6026345.1 hypothetical protein [Segatella cerevisiae]
MERDDNIQKELHDILDVNMQYAKSELSLFKKQTRETLQYKSDIRGYIKDLLAGYSKFSTNEDGTINMSGIAYTNGGFPKLSEDGILSQMEQLYMRFAHKPKFGRDVIINAAKSDGRLFLVKYCKYNYLKDLLGESGQPQQAQTPREKRQRHKVTFRDKLLAENKDEALAKLHSLIDGRIGKYVALVILESIEEGILQKPTYKQVKDEFGDIGAESGYNRYVSEERMYTKAEIDGMRNRLKE